MHAVSHKPRDNRVRVLIVDEHPVVVAGLKSFLRETDVLDVVATASNLEDALGRSEHLRPDIILLALSGANLAPVELLKKLRAARPEVAIVVLEVGAPVATAKQLLAAGANVHLARGSERDAILTALHRLITTDETGARRMIAPRETLPPPPSSSRGSLSRRELQVLTLIADGNTNKEVADELGISVRTVETHRERLMRKLNVQGTAALTRAAISLGLVGTKP
jgi:two-component system NarL family response regulator